MSLRPLHAVLVLAAVAAGTVVTLRTGASSPPTDVSTQRREWAAILRRLKTSTLDLLLRNQSMEEGLRLVEARTGIPIRVDPRIAEALGATVNIEVEGVSVEQVLDMLTAAPESGDVVWTIQGDAVVFTKREFVRPALVLRQHSVADLTGRLTDFIPPRIDLVSGDEVNDESHPFAQDVVELPRPVGTIEDVIELVKCTVGEPGTWDEPDASISTSGTTAIIVKHTEEVQAEVARFLAELRDSAARSAPGSPPERR